MSVKDDTNRDDQQDEDISRLKGRVNLWIALLPTLAFIVAASQAAVAYYQLKTGRTQFFQDQRPYVMPRTGNSNFIPGQQLMVNFRIGNYGKSPAIEAGGAGKVFVGDDALQQADRWFSDELPQVIGRRNRTIIPPNTPASHADAADTTVLSDKPFTAAEIDALMKKSFSIVAVMRQAYRDTAGNEYWTDVCVSNLATGPNSMRIVECKTHNHVE